MLIKFFLVIVAAGIWLLPALQAQSETPSPSPEPAEKIDIPIPIGQPVKGIRVPHFGEDGELAMEFEAEIAEKLEENLVRMENLRIDVYDEDKRKVVISLPKSTFNLESKILQGKDSVLIQREDFKLEGDTIDFDTTTRNGKIGGQVKMVIYNIEKFE